MADDSKDWGESKLRVEEMPISVQKLVDAMLSIDPHFSIESWLEEKAKEDLNLIKSDINREKIQLEQRLYRLQNIVNKLDPVDIREVPNGQTNLFDCFDIPESFKHISERIEDSNYEEPHPAGAFINLFPNDDCDDPLLAVTAQMMLIFIQEKTGKGASWVEIAEIYKPMIENGVSIEECDEAIDHLLVTGQIHEIDDDCFIADE
tara:strand:- start:3 stop:617 length:615 start_codon:yes stop_codon:yes gene_type:complete